MLVADRETTGRGQRGPQETQHAGAPSCSSSSSHRPEIRLLAPVLCPECRRAQTVRDAGCGRGASCAWHPAVPAVCAVPSVPGMYRVPGIPGVHGVLISMLW